MDSEQRCANQPQHEQDELVQGRGNQMTAITEVYDKLSNGMVGMAKSLDTRNEQMERINGGLGYIQTGQSMMQDNIKELLEQTRRLTVSITDIRAQIENISRVVNVVSSTETNVKSQLTDLQNEVHELDKQLNDFLKRVTTSAIVASTPVAPVPVNTPESPAPQEKDKTHVE